ncbi:MAG TPA: pyridoxal-dependent decarboxylase [Candidatus Limnocylindrales bacterium]|nr:pyridoxal-dependent decarboxylase [Candidatus Limnocylindrales bacterium]
MRDSRWGEQTADLLRSTSDYATDFLRGLPDRPVHATVDRDQLRAQLGGPLPDEPEGAAEVIERLRASEGGLVGIAGPRYFGFVIGGSLPAALAADWLTSTWDQNAGAYVAGPSASVAEEVAGGWLLELLGLPETAGFGLTTGCQMAHVTCLAAARHAVLERAGWDVERLGLSGAPPIRIVIGDEAHATVPAALQYLGLGYETPVRVPADSQGRMTLDGLEHVLVEGEPGVPTIVVLQAGNVNPGSFDPLAGAIRLVRKTATNAWIHVDGAFGLWAAASEKRRHLLDGYVDADSWATDGHKWLNVPYDCGYAIVADSRTHRSAMAPPHAAYIEYGTTERDEFDWVMEYSRRARGFATWAALRSLGRSGVEELVDRCCEHALRFAELLGAEAGVEILNDVVLNQVLVRFGDDDELTREVIRRVQQDGTCWLGGSTWQGRAVMRISVSSWATTTDDVELSARAILRCHAAAQSRGSDLPGTPGRQA